MKLTDNLILIPWILGLINIFSPFNNSLLFWVASLIFYFLVVVHIAECIIYRNKIIEGPDAKLGFIYTFIYGILYLKTFINNK